MEECKACGATENIGWANEDGVFKLCIGGCAMTDSKQIVREALYALDRLETCANFGALVDSDYTAVKEDTQTVCTALDNLTDINEAVDWDDIPLDKVDGMIQVKFAQLDNEIDRLRSERTDTAALIETVEGMKKPPSYKSVTMNMNTATHNAALDAVLKEIKK